MNGGDKQTEGELSFAEITMADEAPSIGDEVDIQAPDADALAIDFDHPTPEDVARLLNQIEDHLGRLELDDYVRSDLFKELKGARRLMEDQSVPRQLLTIAMETVTKKLEAAYDTGENVQQLLPWAQMAQEMIKTIDEDAR